MAEPANDDYRDDRLTTAQTRERELLWVQETDRYCEICGKDWTFAEIDDPTWFVETVLVPNEDDRRQCERISRIRCPECW